MLSWVDDNPTTIFSSKPNAEVHPAPPVPRLSIGSITAKPKEVIQDWLDKIGELPGPLLSGNRPIPTHSHAVMLKSRELWRNDQVGLKTHF